MPPFSLYVCPEMRVLGRVSLLFHMKYAFFMTESLCFLLDVDDDDDFVCVAFFEVEKYFVFKGWSG